MDEITKWQHQYHEQQKTTHELQGQLYVHFCSAVYIFEEYGLFYQISKFHVIVDHFSNF